MNASLYRNVIDASLSTDTRDSSDKLAAATFAYTALSDSCQSTVCSTFRVTIQPLAILVSFYPLCPLIVGLSTGFKHQQNLNKTCRTCDVSLLSNLDPVLSVRIGYARFATCRPRGAILEVCCI
jgi:hypothetical protein